MQPWLCCIECTSDFIIVCCSVEMWAAFAIFTLVTWFIQDTTCYCLCNSIHWVVSLKLMLVVLHTYFSVTEQWVLTWSLHITVQCCFHIHQGDHTVALIKVPTGPWKSWNLFFSYSRPGKSLKRGQILESPWISSLKSLKFQPTWWARLKTQLQVSIDKHRFH